MKQIITVFAVLMLSITVNAQPGLRVLDPELKNYQYPYKVAYLTLQVQGERLRMAYMDVKPALYNGKNVLLLHGKNFNGAYWKTTIDALLRQGYRVIVPDQVGFGKSSKPIHFQYSFHQLAANTKLLLDSLGIKETAVLGHSMGGMLATRFALMFPGITEKLILENPIGLEDYKTMVPYTPVHKLYEQELRANYQSMKAYQLQFYYDNRWKPEYDQWLNLLAGWTLSKDYPIIARTNALTSDMIFTQPVVYELANIKVPTLLIIGTRDRTAIGKNLAPPEIQPTMGLYGELGRRAQQLIPGSHLVELADVGHLPHIEAFNLFIEPLQQFLKTNTTKQ